MLFFHFLNELQPPCRSNSVGIMSMPPGPMLSTHTLHRQVARCLQCSGCEHAGCEQQCAYTDRHTRCTGRWRAACDALDVSMQDVSSSAHVQTDTRCISRWHAACGAPDRQAAASRYTGCDQQCGNASRHTLHRPVARCLQPAVAAGGG
jgi:hypothetical protein